MNQKLPMTAACDNVLASMLGEACRAAADAPAGDYIDRGLALLRELNERGFDVIASAESLQHYFPGQRQ